MIIRTPSRRTVAGLWIATILTACGGATFDSNGSGNTTSTGGMASATGGNSGVAGGSSFSGGQSAVTGGQSAVTSSAAGAGSGTTCCLALAICSDGDKQIGISEPCPNGASCYVNELCCQRIQCVHSLPVPDAGSAGGTSVASGGNCAAIPTCDSGDGQTTSTCPSSAVCYTRSMCGTTINCAHKSYSTGGASSIDAGVQCNAYPTCNAGDSTVSVDCPTGGKCYQRSLCGTIINCLTASDAGSPSDASVCDPSTEFNRKYVSTSVSGCMAVKFECPSRTQPFSNDCGCGCLQNSSCPQWVDCMPGPSTLSPLCSNDECPYTLRAM